MTVEFEPKDAKFLSEKDYPKSYYHVEIITMNILRIS